MTPSPQTTEGLGATPLTAEELAHLRRFRPLDLVRSHRAIDGLLATLDAARLSVPSEALAEALGRELDRLLVDAHGVGDEERIEWTKRLARAAKRGLRLAALPNREDAPEPPDQTRAFVRWFLAKPVDARLNFLKESFPLAEDRAWLAGLAVREDAPSREGLDRQALLAALDHQAADENLSPSFRKGIEFARGYISLWFTAPADDHVKERFRAALAATPPGDREELSQPLADFATRMADAILDRPFADPDDDLGKLSREFFRRDWTAAVTTAEAAAGEEG